MVRRSVMAATFLIGFVLCMVLFTPFAGLLARQLVVEDTVPAEASAVVVLSAGVDQSGLPDGQTLTRLGRGLELFSDGVAPVIITAGGPKVGEGRTFASCMRDQLLRWGVSPDRVLIHDETEYTHNDIAGVLEMHGKTMDMDSAVFVTSGYHTYRVKMVLAKQGSRAVVVSADSYEHRPRRMGARLEVFVCTLREYLAIIVSKVMGYI